MAPAWEKLMEKYADDQHAVVAEVDCTAGGKSLCDQVGVQGFPTLKWGDVSALEDYEGGRDEEALMAFAEENMKPLCNPQNIDLCDEEKKAQIQKLQAKYEELSSEKDAAIKAVKTSGLGMMKAVRASKPKEEKAGL